MTNKTPPLIETAEYIYPSARAKSLGRRIRLAFIHFVWWATGKSSAILTSCADPVRSKYTAIGVWVTFVVPVLAGFAMAEFLATMGFGTLSVYFGAIFWSLTIFSMERMILTSPNHKDKGRNWLRAIPRFIIALCVSLLVTEALISKAFKSSIEVELARTVDISVEQKGASERARSSEQINALNLEKNHLTARLNQLFSIKLAAEKAMHDEGDGTGGSFDEGEGKHYIRRKEAFQRATEEYDREKPAIEAKILPIEAELAAINSRIAQAESDRRLVEDEARGPLARHEAMMRLVTSSKSAAFLYLVMFIGLMTAELLALLTKLVADPDEYDDLVEYDRDRRELSLREWHARLRQLIVRTNSIQAAIQKRILDQVKAGEPDRLPQAERGLGLQIHHQFIRSSADEMCDLEYPAETNEVTESIRLEIVGRPDLNAQVSLPKSEITNVTMHDLRSELHRIAEALYESDGHFYILDKAENSIGREIWQYTPFVTQLEPDRLARLTFVSAGPDLGLSG